MQMLKLTFYVPESHLESVKSAVFQAGAGQLGDYDCCSWQIQGNGQFRPLAGSNPFLGTTGELERVEEFRVEMVVEKTRAINVQNALLASHPYETPAYDFVELWWPEESE